MNKLFYTITFFGLLSSASNHPMDNSKKNLENAKSDILDYSWDYKPEQLSQVIDALKNECPTLPYDLLIETKEAFEETTLHCIAKSWTYLDEEQEKEFEDNAIKCADILLKNCSALITSKNNGDETPLHTILNEAWDTERKVPLKLIKFLIEKTPKSVFYDKDSEYNTPLSYIFLNKNCHELLPELQKKEITDFDTPPISASSHKYYDMTPLFLATEGGCDYKSIKALLEAGADPRIISEEWGLSPAEYAEHKECEELLDQYGSAYTWTPQLLRTLRLFGNQGSINSFKRMKK